MVVSGEIEAVCKVVSRLKVDDQICAYDLTRLSAYAEYACMSENSVVVCKPSPVTYEKVVANPFEDVPALHFPKRGKIRSGQKVLIYGASGNDGTFPVQLAKYFGS